MTSGIWNYASSYVPMTCGRMPGGTWPTCRLRLPSLSIPRTLKWGRVIMPFFTLCSTFKKPQLRQEWIKYTCPYRAEFFYQATLERASNFCFPFRNQNVSLESSTSSCYCILQTGTIGFFVFFLTIVVTCPRPLEILWVAFILNFP
jgi:hypothetical protein